MKKTAIILFTACLLIIETSQAQDSLHQAKPHLPVETKTHAPYGYSSEYYAEEQEDENYRLDHDRCGTVSE
jgi:hypothetical protein